MLYYSKYINPCTSSTLLLLFLQDRSNLTDFSMDKNSNRGDMTQDMAENHSTYSSTDFCKQLVSSRPGDDHDSHDSDGWAENEHDVHEVFDEDDQKLSPFDSKELVLYRPQNSQKGHTGDTSKQTSFLDLPAELRNEIYEHLVPDALYIQVVYEYINGSLYEWEGPAIYHVNRQIQDETAFMAQEGIIRVLVQQRKFEIGTDITLVHQPKFEIGIDSWESNWLTEANEAVVPESDQHKVEIGVNYSEANWFRGAIDAVIPENDLPETILPHSHFRNLDVYLFWETASPELRHPPHLLMADITQERHHQLLGHYNKFRHMLSQEAMRQPKLEYVVLKMRDSPERRNYGSYRFDYWDYQEWWLLKYNLVCFEPLCEDEKIGLDDPNEFYKHYPPQDTEITHERDLVVLRRNLIERYEYYVDNGIWVCECFRRKVEELRARAREEERRTAEEAVAVVSDENSTW